MGRRAKRARTKVERELAAARKSLRNEASKRRELEKRLAESLEREKATSEILRVISSSPTDVKPIFDAIVRSASRLCGGEYAIVVRYDGELLHLAAQHNPRPGTAEETASFYPQVPRREESVTARALLEITTVHIADVETEDFSPSAREALRRIRLRAVVAVPMIHEGRPIGVVSVCRETPVPFSDHQIDLLRTFADQAVIAIENVRLFTESQEKNRALTQAHARVTEALEQQTATSEILRVISSSPTDVLPVFEAIARSAARLCDSYDAQIFRVNGDFLRLEASHGSMLTPESEIIAGFPIGRGWVTGRAIVDRRTVHIPDLAAVIESEFPGARDAQARQGTRTALATPLMREGVPIGAILVRRLEVQPFSEKHIELMKTFADQAVIAIENVRLFTELQEKNRALTEAHAQVTEALEQQTATAEILRVISSSPTDVQPVFDTIVSSAVRLCDGLYCALFQFDGELISDVAHHNFTPEALEEMHRIFPARPTRALLPGRAILERAVVHIPDILELDPEFRVQAVARTLGFRSGLWVPMLREGAPLGVIAVTRAEPGLFSDSEIELLKTFADQAVIATENVRLFTELQEKNRALTEAHARATEALDQQTATAEVLRVISSSPTDVQPVFDAIANSARRLLAGHSVSVSRVVRDELHLMAFSTTSAAADALLRSNYPMRLDRVPLAARVMRERTTAIVTDIDTDLEVTESMREVGRARGFRSFVWTLMVRDDVVIGIIAVTRREPGAFTDSDVALLQTFADQAVIAIENVRLFTELQEKNSALTKAHAQVTEALDQQMATGEILRVIASSPTDIQPVFAAVAASAARLCDAFDATIFQIDGDRLRVAVHNGPIASHPVGQGPSLARGTPSGRAVFDRRAIHIADTQAETDEYPEGSEHARRLGFRTVLAVPLMREDLAIGVINLRRTETRLFTERQVALLETFADQAVIAIENVRLFKELQQKNAALTQAHAQVTEALEQQMATSEILKVIASSPTDTQPVFDAIVESAARLCGVDDGFIVLVEGDALRAVAATGQFVARTADYNVRRLPVSRESVAGRAIVDRATIHIADLAAESEAELPEGRALQRVYGHRTMLATPLLREGAAIGVIVLFRFEVRLFSERQIELLKTFADQAVIAIENVRLFNETKEALEQQTATAEILRVISSSPTDVQPVFEAIAEHATRLCWGLFTAVFRFEGEQLHFVAHNGIRPEGLALMRQLFPARPHRGVAAGRAILDRTTVHVPDIEQDPEPDLRRLAGTVGWRSNISVPMLRDGAPIGAISVARTEVGPFPGKQIALLQTFADQAVIAIENVRLFKELEARTTDLTHSVRHLTALGEVGQAVSSTLDLETVLTTIVSRAVALSGAAAGTIFEYDEATQEFGLRATHNTEPELIEIQRAEPVRLGQGAVGQAAARREPVQVSDIREAPFYSARPRVRDLLVESGYRSVLAVPLLVEDRILGALVVLRREVGEFSPETVNLLKTFASQSALAIQNARLFREIEEKGRELQAASLHKSEFLANMSHELRTPMNAILGFNEMILGGVYGDVSQELKVPLADIQQSGKHLLRLINNVLDLSKIEAGRTELTLGEYLAQDAVATVGTSLRSLAIEKGLDFVISAPESLPVARGDAGRITQCLMNLAGNALKFTRQGRVEIAVELRGDVLRYRVADTGIGIASDQLETVFGEFRQGDPTIAREFGGTGLGLSITKKFVELHGGRIWVESELGRGSTFFLEIPLRVELAETS